MNLESIFFLFFFFKSFHFHIFQRRRRAKVALRPRFDFYGAPSNKKERKKNENQKHSSPKPNRIRSAGSVRSFAKSAKQEPVFSLSLSLSLWFGLVWFVLGSFVGFASADWSASGDQSGSRFRDRAKLFELDLTLSCAALSFPS